MGDLGFIRVTLCHQLEDKLYLISSYIMQNNCRSNFQYLDIDELWKQQTPVLYLSIYNDLLIEQNWFCIAAFFVSGGWMANSNNPPYKIERTWNSKGIVTNFASVKNERTLLCSPPYTDLSFVDKPRFSCILVFNKKILPLIRIK